MARILLCFLWYWTIALFTHVVYICCCVLCVWTGRTELWQVAMTAMMARLCWCCHTALWIRVAIFPQSCRIVERERHTCSWFIKLAWQGVGECWTLICGAFSFSVLMGWWIKRCPISDNLFMHFVIFYWFIWGEMKGYEPYPWWLNWISESAIWTNKKCQFLSRWR